MASNQKVIYVYESFRSTTPNFLGTLFVENVRGRESYSFEYDADWLKSSANYMYLDPDLQLYAGRQYPTGAKNVFGLFADSSPDRWGRLLMTRRERILAEQEGRKPRKLLDSDFLMGVYDETRMGAIRFKLDKDGRFSRMIRKPQHLPGPACERWRRLPVNLKTMSPVSNRNGSISSSSPVPRWVALVRRPPFWTQAEICGSPSFRPSTTMPMLAHGKRLPMTLQDFAAWMFPSPC